MTIGTMLWCSVCKANFTDAEIQAYTSTIALLIFLFLAMAGILAYVLYRHYVK